MASAGNQLAASTSSSSSTHRRKYDLFLSFRGKDTRYEFADTLFTALKRWGIVVFRDDEGLQRGEEINPALEDAIKKSHYAVVIVSPNYTKSKACLMELTVILECKRQGHLDIFPVFYHIDPSNVGKLRTDFEGYLDTHKNYTEDPKANSEYWKSLLDKLFDGHVDLKEMSRTALKKLSDISAWLVRENSYINPIIDEICRAIWVRTISDLPHISENLVGIESRVAKVMRLLQLEKEDEVRVVGICGMGGIGKSTLAKFIYKRLLPCFEARYFSNPIGKEKDKEHLVHVQEKLIYDIFPEGAANLSNNAFKVEQVFQTKLQERKVLIVLDDLWDTFQVKQLVGDLKWFGLGSRIIITSRIHDLLHLKKDDNIYEVEELNEDDALKLFYMKAFKQPQPKDGFEQLSKKVVDHAKGHPFALDIFGSYLSNKETKDRWDGYLKDLGTNLEHNIGDTLRKSIEELDKGINSFRQVFPVKELFLDIACFFNRHLRNDVLYILEGGGDFGDNLTHNFSVLEEMSLLKISDDQKLVMHDFLVDLAQQIAKSSRLLQQKDIIHVLESPSIENSQVKGIVLKLFPKEQRTFHLEALSIMVDLRVLQISYDYGSNNFGDEMEEFGKDLDHNDEVEDKMLWCGDFTRIKWIGDLSRFKLSADLRIMKWEHYPLQSLPKGSNFAPTKLVMLTLSESRIKRLWDGKKSFPKLRHINLCGCEELIEIPDMSQVPNLEILDLGHCHRLSMVHSSIGGLKRLRELHVQSCHRLERFPDVICSECLEVLDFSFVPRLQKFPNILFSLPILQTLDIYDTNFKEHPLLSTAFPSLVSLDADALYMKGLPSCIASSKKLAKLSFSCPTYFRFPTWFPELISLECLTMRYCDFSDELDDLVEVTPIRKIPLSKPLLSLHSLILEECQTLDVLEIPLLISLESLNLDGNRFKKVPDIISELSNLRSLELAHSTSLEALSKLPLSLRCLTLADCPSLEVFDSQMIEQISKEILWASGCSFMVAYIGFKGKSYKLLYLHPKSPPYIGYTHSSSDLYFDVIIYQMESAAACGPTLEPRITDWFIHRNSSSGKEIQIAMDWNSKSKPWVCALLIVYEVYGHDKRQGRKQILDELENSDIGASEDNNSICPEFVCQLQLNETSPKHTFVVCVPEVAHVGSHGLWVCINSNSNFDYQSNGLEYNSFQESKSMKGWSSRVSITASSKNVVLKEGGARLLNRDAYLELVKVVTTISRCGLDSQSLDLSLNNCLTIEGPSK